MKKLEREYPELEEYHTRKMSSMHQIGRGYHFFKSLPTFSFGQILELLETLENRLPGLAGTEAMDYWNGVFDDMNLRAENGEEYPST